MGQNAQNSGHQQQRLPPHVIPPASVTRVPTSNMRREISLCVLNPTICIYTMSVLPCTHNVRLRAFQTFEQSSFVRRNSLKTRHTALCTLPQYPRSGLPQLPQYPRIGLYLAVLTFYCISLMLHAGMGTKKGYSWASSWPGGLKDPHEGLPCRPRSDFALFSDGRLQLCPKRFTAKREHGFCDLGQSLQGVLRRLHFAVERIKPFVLVTEASEVTRSQPC